MLHTFLPSSLSLPRHGSMLCAVVSFVRSFVRSLVRSLARSLAHLSVRSFIRSFVCSFVRSFVRLRVFAVSLAAGDARLTRAMAQWQRGRLQMKRSGFELPRLLLPQPCVFPCIENRFADGHTVSNAPDLFRPPKLSGTGPG